MGACASSTVASQATPALSDVPCDEHDAGASPARRRVAASAASPGQKRPAGIRSSMGSDVVVALTGSPRCGKHSLAAAMASLCALPLNRKVSLHTGECASFSGTVSLGGVEAQLHIVKVPHGQPMPDGIDAIVHCVSAMQQHPFDGLYSIVDDIAHEPEAVQVAGLIPHSGRSLTPTSYVSSVDVTMEDMAAYLPYIMGTGDAKTSLPDPAAMQGLPASAGAPAPAPASAPAPAAAPACAPLPSATGGYGAGAGAGSVTTTLVVPPPPTPDSTTAAELSEAAVRGFVSAGTHQHDAAGPGPGPGPGASSSRFAIPGPSSFGLDGVAARGSLGSAAWAGYGKRSTAGISSSSNAAHDRSRGRGAVISNVPEPAAGGANASLAAARYGQQLSTSSPTAAAALADPQTRYSRSDSASTAWPIRAAPADALTATHRYGRNQSSTSVSTAADTAMASRHYSRKLSSSSTNNTVAAAAFAGARRLSRQLSSNSNIAVTDAFTASRRYQSRKLSSSSNSAAAAFSGSRRHSRALSRSSLVTPNSILLDCSSPAAPGQVRSQAAGGPRTQSCPVSGTGYMAAVFQQAESVDSYFARRRAKLCVFTGFETRKLGSLPEDDAPIISIAVTKSDKLSKADRSYVRSQARSWGTANRCSVTMTSAVTNYGCTETLTDVLRQIAIRRASVELPTNARRPPTF